MLPSSDMNIRSTLIDISRKIKNCHVIYPPGKPRILHLLCCQGLAVGYYGFALDAADLQHPRLLQRWGEDELGEWSKKNRSMKGT